MTSIIASANWSESTSPAAGRRVLVGDSANGCAVAFFAGQIRQGDAALMLPSASAGWLSGN